VQVGTQFVRPALLTAIFRAHPIASDDFVAVDIANEFKLRVGLQETPNLFKQSHDSPPKAKERGNLRRDGSRLVEENSMMYTKALRPAIR
jgi:hypothetical protein